ncbi:MAG: hypothetical protein Q8K60_07575 [Parachlamydiaceae bacterium]|nr:hypothetical protein [Parachlamydiaceae bacterium]
MRQLIALLLNDMTHECSLETLINSELRYPVYLFQWQLLIFDNYQYVKMSPLKLFNYTHLTIRENALNLSWKSFRELLIPLIINFSNSKNLKIVIPDYLNKPSLHFLCSHLHEKTNIYSVEEMLVFLDRDDASPKELITEISCLFKTNRKNQKTESKITQAKLRMAFNYGRKASFPDSIDFNEVKKIWDLAYSMFSSFKNEYNYEFRNYKKTLISLDQFYFALKLFDNFYQGDPTSLIEYQNAIKHLEINKQKIKTIDFCLDLNSEDLKNKIKEFLSVYKNSDQRFKLERYEAIFPRQLLKYLINSGLTSYLASYIHTLDTDEYYNALLVTSDIFFRILFYSLNLSKNFPKHCFTQIVKNHNEGGNNHYHFNLTNKVIANASNFWCGIKLKQMNIDEAYDLLFLFSRAQIECQQLEADIRNVSLNTQQEKQLWKRNFVKWNVAFNSN